MAYRLREHGLVVVLQPVRRHHDGQEPPVDLADELLLLPRRPRPVATVRVQDPHGHVVVDRVDGRGLLQRLDMFVLECRFDVLVVVGLRGLLGVVVCRVLVMGIDTRSVTG